jgi:hypothetical protein
VKEQIGTGEDFLARITKTEVVSVRRQVHEWQLIAGKFNSMNAFP